MSVKITKKDEAIIVKSNFHPEFASPAKMLGGRWNPKTRTWTFDTRDEDSVRDLCLDLFGTDGNEDVDTPLCDVRVRLSPSERSVWFCGREIAKRSFRDSSVRLGDKVVLKEGSFPASGGSRNYPTLSGNGVVLEVRDVPVVLAKREAEKNPNDVTILSTDIVENTIVATIHLNSINSLDDLRAYLEEIGGLLVTIVGNDETENEPPRTPNSSSQ